MTSTKRNSAALTVKVPISRTSSANNISKWINSLNKITEEDLNPLTSYELKLIILSARDREQTSRSNVNVNAGDLNILQPTLNELTQNLKQLTEIVEKNSRLIVQNANTTKTYAQAASTDPPVSCEQMRVLLHEEEEKRRSMIAEEKDKFKREKNIIVYGLPEKMTLLDATDEFKKIALELDSKPNVIKADRLGQLKSDNKPQPICFKLESKYEKQRIVTSAYKLKSTQRFRNIYLNPDLTKMERILQKDDWENLKQSITEHPDKRWKIKNFSVVEISPNVD